MKKISLFVLALSAGLAVSAQNDKPARTSMSTQPRIGLRAGANLAWLELDDENTTTNWNTNTKTSFHGGVFFNLPLGGALRLQPEVSYSRQGSKVTGTQLVGTNNNAMYEVDVHYVNIPVMLQVQSPGGFFVEVGPQLGIRGSAEQENEDDSKTDVKALFRSTDFAVNGGIGYLSRVGLGINARYVHGLSNVFNTDEAPSGTADREISNRAFQIGLVYQFGAHK